MSLELITAPAEEPVSLADAKAHLRVDTNDDDALITRLIAAARQAAEEATGRAFVAQTWRLWLDGWPSEWAIELPRPPLIGVSSITAYDRNGNATVVDAETYLVDAAARPGRVVFDTTVLPPVILRAANAIAVEFDAGYGAAAVVPAGIVAGVLAWIAHLYELRGESETPPPAQALALLAPYRVFAL
ncbi:MAG: head-tail connector protein [Alphaproteobacteria bacterium]